jgi:hypothetical protein
MTDHGVLPVLKILASQSAEVVTMNDHGILPVSKMLACPLCHLAIMTMPRSLVLNMLALEDQPRGEGTVEVPANMPHPGSDTEGGLLFLGLLGSREQEISSVLGSRERFLDIWL